jgi:hypothetical protein
VLIAAPEGFVAAWHHSGVLWRHTLAVIAEHPLPVLACAAIPAVIRAYMLLRLRPMASWRVAVVDFVLMLFRLALCFVAVRVVLTPLQWQQLGSHITSNGRMQVALQEVGGRVGTQLHMYLWELALFLLAFMLLHFLLHSLARLLAAFEPKRYSRFVKTARRKAMDSALRNLILAPLLLIYIVEMAQQVFE